MAIKLFVIFFASLFINGVVFPALFDFRDSLLITLAIFLPVIYLGPGKRPICFGLAFAIISELFRGLDFGTLAVPFLLTVSLVCLAQRFIDIKFTYDTRFNFSRSILSALVAVLSIYVFSAFYEWNGWKGIGIAYFNFMISLTIMLEALVLVFIFTVIFNKRSDYL